MKSDLAIVEGEQAVVRDSHAMGVAAEIMHDIFRATEGAFQVDDPIVSVEGPQPSGEDLGLREKLQVSVEVELAILKSFFESVNELAAKDFLQHFFGQEVVVAGVHPAGVIRREAASWHNAMHMRVSAELLAPGMQDSEEADLRAEMSVITSEFQESRGTGAEQEIVEDLFVL